MIEQRKSVSPASNSPEGIRSVRPYNVPAASTHEENLQLPPSTQMGSMVYSNDNKMNRQILAHRLSIQLRLGDYTVVEEREDEESPIKNHNEKKRKLLSQAAGEEPSRESKKEDEPKSIEHSSKLLSLKQKDVESSKLEEPRSNFVSKNLRVSSKKGSKKIQVFSQSQSHSQSQKRRDSRLNIQPQNSFLQLHQVRPFRPGKPKRTLKLSPQPSTLKIIAVHPEESSEVHSGVKERTSECSRIDELSAGVVRHGRDQEVMLDELSIEKGQAIQQQNSLLPPGRNNVTSIDKLSRSKKPSNFADVDFEDLESFQSMDRKPALTRQKSISINHRLNLRRPPALKLDEEKLPPAENAKSVPKLILRKEIKEEDLRKVKPSRPSRENLCTLESWESPIHSYGYILETAVAKESPTSSNNISPAADRDKDPAQLPPQLRIPLNIIKDSSLANKLSKALLPVVAPDIQPHAQLQRISQQKNTSHPYHLEPKRYQSDKSFVQLPSSNLALIGNNGQPQASSGELKFRSNFAKSEEKSRIHSIFKKTVSKTSSNRLIIDGSEPHQEPERLNTMITNQTSFQSQFNLNLAAIGNPPQPKTPLFPTAFPQVANPSPTTSAVHISSIPPADSAPLHLLRNNSQSPQKRTPEGRPYGKEKGYGSQTKLDNVQGGGKGLVDLKFVIKKNQMKRMTLAKMSRNKQTVADTEDINRPSEEVSIEIDAGLKEEMEQVKRLNDLKEIALLNPDVLQATSPEKVSSVSNDDDSPMQNNHKSVKNTRIIPDSAFEWKYKRKRELKGKATRAKVAKTAALRKHNSSIPVASPEKEPKLDQEITPTSKSPNP